MPEPTTLTVPTPDGAMPAHLWLPRAGSGPGILLLQEIFGVSAYIRSRAADLAGLGYVVLAPELYWRAADAEVDETREDFLEQAMGIAGSLDWETTVADTVAALGTLAERPEVTGGTGVLGFCYGGGLAFHVAAVAEVDALIAYYGSAIPSLLHLADEVGAPSLHILGGDDAFLPDDLADRLRQTGGQVETHVHDGAGHAFDNPHPAFHHPEASAAAWRQTEDFLARHLPAGSGLTRTM
ncbi:dienelactone hydrolase family protein [Georgenia alba]|uniref:Dienelactone hydrolase family protein n=1 Tax=Georgenia alba TaxID=2233858 RepID=A0ABW2Q5T7_9MICO